MKRIILIILVGVFFVSLGFAEQAPVLAKIVQTGSSPEGMAVNPVTHKAYIVGEDATVGKAVLVFDSGLLTKVVPILNESEYITVDPVRNLIYVATKYGYRDAETGDDEESETDDEGPEPVEPPPNQILCIGTLTVIDGRTDTVIATWYFPEGIEPEGVAVDSASSVVYVAAKAPEGESPDDITCTTGVPIPDVGEPGDVECWTGGYIYAFLFDSASKAVTHLKTIPAGDDPESLVFTDGKVYAANEDDGTVTIASAITIQGGSPESGYTFSGGELLTDTPVPPTNAGFPYSLAVFYPFGPNPLACVENKFEADKMAIGGGSAFITDDRSRVAKITGTDVVGMWDVPGATVCEEIPNTDGGGANTANKIAFIQRNDCQLLYVVSEQNTVAIFDPKSMDLKETITIPEAVHLDAIGVDDAANRIWVTDEDLPAAFVVQGACATGPGNATSNSQEVSTDQETPLAITLTATGSASSFLVGTPMYGTLSGRAPNLTYTPNPGYYGPDSFRFRVNDGTVDSPEATVAITVRRVMVRTTVRAEPPERIFTVDGIAFTGTQTFSWGLRTVHILGVSSPQAGSTDTQYVFANWSDGGAAVHAITASAATPTHTASFATQYLLRASASPAAGGTVSPPTGFYNADSVIAVSATTNEGYAFASWRGDLSDANNPTTVTMSGPRTLTANFSALQPAVTITTPNSGEKLFTTSPYAIRWSATNVSAGSTFSVSFSPNGGNTFTQLPGCAGGLPSTARSCVWSAPGPVTSNGRIKVEVINAGSLVASDISDAAFSVASSVPMIMVTTPNTALTWAVGTVQTIWWNHNLGLNSSVNVDISRNGGVSWAPIASGLKNATASAGSYTWTVTGPATPAALVRVSWADGTARDASNLTFSISNPILTVTLPSTAVNWAVGTLQVIRWNYNMGANTHYTIELTRDGTTWETLNPDFLSTTPGAASWNWTVAGPATATAQIRVRWLSNSANISGNVNFSIAEPYITVGQPPLSIANWGYGTLRRITWTTNLTTAPVDVELSTDGGISFPILLGSTAASARSLIFTTPTLGLATAAARVRVRMQSNQAVQGINPTNFTIAPPFVALARPNGTETWTSGSNASVNWVNNLGSSEAVAIELSLDGGVTYPISIVETTPSDGAQAVLVQSGWQTTEARVRVTWLDNVAVSDMSNANFTVR
jgi:hypothetical protein